MMKNLQKIPLIRPLVIALCLLALWQIVVSIGDIPPYLLPSPLAVWQKFGENVSLLWQHAQITLLEIGLG